MAEKWNLYLKENKTLLEKGLKNLASNTLSFLNNVLTLSQTKKFPRLKVFAEDNFKFDDNGRRLSKKVENTVGRREIAGYEQYLLFPQFFFFFSKRLVLLAISPIPTLFSKHTKCFQKTCTAGNLSFSQSVVFKRLVLLTRKIKGLF